MPCEILRSLCSLEDDNARIYRVNTKNILFYFAFSSIATATATVILNLRVVTCADETHHFVAVDALGKLQSGMLFEKSYYIRLRNPFYRKIIFTEHIVCVFPENIITRFDVAVNDVSGEFAKRLRLTRIFTCNFAMLKINLIINLKMIKFNLTND